MGSLFAWQDSFAIGQGFDLEAGTQVKSAKAGFDPPSEQALVTDGGSQADRERLHADKMYLVVSSDDSATAVDASLDVAGKGVGWNAEAAAKVSSISKHSARAISAMRQIRVVGSSLLVPPSQRLSDEAATLLSQGHKAFRAAYGTHFIAGQVLAASFVGNVDYEFDSVDSKLDVAATLSGSMKGGAVSGNARASMNLALQEVSAKAQTSCGALAVGGEMKKWSRLDYGSWEQLEKAAGDYLDESTASTLVPVYAVVEPWSMLDEVPSEVSLVGPDDPETDDNIKRVSRAMPELRYLTNLLSTSDPNLLRIDASAEKIAACFAEYLEAEPNDLPSTRTALVDALDAADTLVKDLGIVTTFDVEFTCQYQISHRARTNAYPGVDFEENARYNTLRSAQGTISVEAGQTVHLAEFTTDWHAMVASVKVSNVDIVASVKVSYVDAQPRIQAYFGPTKTEAQAFDGADLGGAAATSAVSADGKTTGNTAKAHTPTVDDQWPNCYVFARLAGAASHGALG